MQNLASPQEQIRRWRADPVFFVRQVLRHDPWHIPECILRDLSRPNARVAVKACHSSGKCVSADELIQLASGEVRLARDLVGQHFEVIVPTADGLLAAEAKADWNIIEQTLSLETKSGRRVIRNAHHPFQVAQRAPRSATTVKAEGIGWLPLAEIKRGDFIAASLQTVVPVEGKEICRDELISLAYLIGNMGYRTVGALPVIPNERCMREMADSLSRLNASMFYSPTGLDRAFEYEIEPFTEGEKNTAIGLLDKYGLLDIDYSHRRLPLSIFSLPYMQKALFVSRLFAFGGYIDENQYFYIHFRCTSENLIRDTQRLLLQIGVSSTIKRAPDHTWDLIINEIDEQIRFLRCAGIFGREDSCMIALRRLIIWQEKRRYSKTATAFEKTLPPLPRDLFWDEVMGVELAGVRPTVAIEVPDYGHYLDLFWEHNTHTAADATLWFTYTGGITITTAPSDDQVERLLWGEIHRTYDQVRESLGGILLNKEIKISPSAYAFGRSTDQGIRFQGHHDRGGGVLVIIDEAPGVAEDIFEAIEGIEAGGDVRLLLLGNPVPTSGRFYDAFHSEEEMWQTHTISAFSTPNLHNIDLDDLLSMSDEELNYNPRPYLTTRRWTRNRWIKWGKKGDPRWQSRVLGEFPGQHTSSLIQRIWVDASERLVAIPENRVFNAGVDVAGSGSDETVVYVRHGGNIVDFGYWPHDDPRSEVEAMLSPWRESGSLTVFVDSNGMGHYFVKHLIDKGFNVVPVNAQSKPNDDSVWGFDPIDMPSKRFMNVKAQAYWNLREMFIKGWVGGLTDPDTKDQLTAIRWFEHPQSGKIVIESKESLRKRGIDSPDRAESLMLSFCDLALTMPNIPLAQGIVSGGWGYVQ